MNKLLVLVACVLGSVSAGRILQRDWQGDIGTGKFPSWDKALKSM